MTPSRGNLLVREVETSETLPGGRIVLPEQVREHYSAMQYECVSVGEPERCEDEDCERQHLPSIEMREINGRRKRTLLHYSHVHAGDWVLTKPRVAIDTGMDGLYIIRQDDVVGVLT